ncbi:MAG TPA: transketolase [Candidatus Megaira endosymbiont of Nemacystus decipiens]|nr:transketolase [Candidatus Megaera endosymbiont of Nemacystus decipiens]
MILNKMQNDSLDQLSDCIKILTIDAVESAKSGHPGMPMGFAQVMTNLVFNFLKYNPNDPKWFNRDRLVLSAGHGSMLLYSFFYLAGYKGFSLEDIQQFRQLGSKAAGHPENHIYNAIETTTGPLGQGLGNAVGMAIAEKKLKNTLGNKICNYKIYAIAGDGCLMEGVSYEALSLAGHLSLDNLIILFDDNNITIDGTTSLCTSEDHLLKFQSMGFSTMSVDGHDQNKITEALRWAQSNKKPSFIAFKTLIGKGSKSMENSSKAHGAPLGVEDIQDLKKRLGYELENFSIKQNLLDKWKGSWVRNKTSYDSWNEAYNKLAPSKKDYINNDVIRYSSDNSFKQADPEATRVSSGKIISKIMKNNEKIIIGSADLAGSNGLKNDHVKNISRNDFSGNFINYGVREHAMAAIMNGLALSSFTPIGGTFFVFSDYMRPAIRLAAMMNLSVIYVMTHDSIGVGEDGPTHQPIEHLASFRAMPNINVFRPCDFIETSQCYDHAIKAKKPAIFALSRQATAQITRNNDSDLSMKGGYIISKERKQNENLDVTIFATGTEVSIAIKVQSILENQNISVRVCSVPCMDILLAQGKSYLKALQGNAKHLCAIEAASSFGWDRLITENGIFFGVNQFGTSAPAKNIYQKFALTAENISNKIHRILLH